MNTSDSPHISEEMIIGWLSGKCNSVLADRIVSHLRSCDQCFVKSGILRIAAKEEKGLKPLKTPESLLQKAYEEFELVSDKSVMASDYWPRVSRIIEWFRQISGDVLTVPRVAVAISAVAIVILTAIIYDRQLEGTKQAEQSKFVLNDSVQAPYQVRVLSKEERGIRVEYVSDTIVILQDFGFSRVLRISNSSGKELARFDFDSTVFRIKFPLPKGEDSVLIQIITLNTVVYEGVITHLEPLGQN